MKPNDIFQKVFEVIVSHDDNYLAVENELIKIYNNEMKYYFTDEYSFDYHELIKVMLDSINIYVETAQINGWARKTSVNKGYYDQNLDLDDVRCLCENLSNQEIVQIMTVNPSFTSALIENVIEVYSNPKFYFEEENKEEVKKENNDVNDALTEQSQKSDGSRNRLRAESNLALLDEALIKTKARGTIGRTGYDNKPYSDNIMMGILNNLIHGNYNYITNNPLDEDNPLRDKISKVSPEEIFAEVLKNAIRLESFCQNEENIKKMSFYGLLPVDIAGLQKVVASLMHDGVNNDNIRQIIHDLDDTSLFILSRCFILSRKDDIIKTYLRNATMQDRYRSLLITNLDKIGDSELIDQINNKK